MQKTIFQLSVAAARSDSLTYYSCAPVYLLCTVPISYIGTGAQRSKCSHLGVATWVVALVLPMRHLIAEDHRDLRLGHSSKATCAHTQTDTHSNMDEWTEGRLLSSCLLTLAVLMPHHQRKLELTDLPKSDPVALSGKARRWWTLGFFQAVLPCQLSN